jgi:hypothetical protein
MQRSSPPKDVEEKLWQKSSSAAEDVAATTGKTSPRQKSSAAAAPGRSYATTTGNFCHGKISLPRQDFAEILKFFDDDLDFFNRRCYTISQ